MVGVIGAKDLNLSNEPVALKSGTLVDNHRGDNESSHMRYVAADTSFIVHFRSIAELSGHEIGISEPFTWLIVNQVIHELDIIKNKGDKKVRARAKAVADVVESSISNGGLLPNGRPLTIHLRKRPFDFHANGLLETEGDHKVLADLLDFALDHKDDELFFLSDDTLGRVRARGYPNISVVKAPIELKVIEADDARDTTIRELKQTVTKLATTQPKLALTFLNGETEIDATVDSYSAESYEELFARARSSQEEVEMFRSRLNQLAQLHPLGTTEIPNPNYEDELEKFLIFFASYFPKSWVRHHRTIKIAPVIHSLNGVQAKDVFIRLSFGTKAKVVSDLDAEEKAPAKPRRSIVRRNFPLTSTTWEMVPNISALSHLGMIRRSNKMVDSDSFEPTIRKLPDDRFELHYRFRRMTQEDSKALGSFYLVFENDAEPRNVGIKFEVRAENSSIVERGNLLLNLKHEEVEIAAFYFMQIDH